MTSPYQDLPPSAFWKTAVADPARDLSALYTPRFRIGPETQIATAGSCFAQHIGTHLKRRGYTVIDAEVPPRLLKGAAAQRFGYDLYSARYGNIYTMRQLLQLVQAAWQEFSPADAIWEKDGRYFDALRPSVEPEGLESRTEVKMHRRRHMRRVRMALRKADVLVFTMGLTEAWTDRDTGTVYPTAPETIAGTFSPEKHVFRNFAVEDIVADFDLLHKILKTQNRDIRFLLTVSPVPLTATASGDHVLVATIRSKSILRAASAILREKYDDVDYFPSYEMIATPFLGGSLFETNMRSVSREGVEKVMAVFFAAHGASDDGAIRRDATVETRQAPAPATSRSADDVVCEDVLLEAFGR